MILYHFTSDRHLCGIARYGLTVGDIPTSLDRNQGRVGVWLTSDETAEGHGLDGGAADKSQFRLSVDIDPAGPALHRWIEWAPSNVEKSTIEQLQRVATAYRTWFIYLGVVDPASIAACVDTRTGLEVADWRDRPRGPRDIKGVPKWRRAAWHKKLLGQVAQKLSAAR